MAKAGKSLSLVVAVAVMLSVGILAMPQGRAEANPGIIYVPDNFTTIQQAVNDATSGDTIIVRDGTYHENVDVDVANLTIQSENGAANCVVNATNPGDHVFEVTANYVNITGFTVENATGIYRAGIYLDGVRHCSISSNNVTNNDYGIYLDSSSNNTFRDNTANSNSYGIYLDSSSNNTMYNNYFNNTNNAWDNGANTWNTTNTTGPNIVGGPYLGGNYWSDYTGNDTNGDGFGDTPYNITGDSNRDYLPLLVVTCNLTVNVTPSGGGNVTVNGTTAPSYPNTTTWNYGDNVTLNATVASGYSFVNWSGDLTGSSNPTNITMDDNYTITANFAAITCNLTVNVTPSGGGNVTVNGTTAPSYPNTTTWNYGDNVTLNATVASGYSFVNWSGDLTGSSNPTNITMDDNYTITANFAAITCNLTVTSNGCCPIDVSGAVSDTVLAGGNKTFTGIVEGGNVTVSADDSCGCCKFDNWSDSGAQTHNITMDSDKSVTANCSGATYYVPDDYAKIQWAVDNATSGDTICVRDGTYHENVDVNTANLTIQSENGTANCVVNATNPADQVFEVTESYVNISGFTVEGADNLGYAGIYLGSGVEHCNISDNDALNNSVGIYLDSSSRNTITGNNASNNNIGIWHDNSNNNVITDNNASSNGVGIGLSSSSNNTITNNTASNNNDGIDLVGLSSSNTLTGNNASNNYQSGIILSSSGNNTLRNNLMSDNMYNFGAEGSSYSEFNNDVDTSNLVDGKPVYYLIGASGAVIDSSSNAGTVYCINCDAMTVKDLTLTHNSYGVYLYDTTSSGIENNTITHCFGGIYLHVSSNNNITGNTGIADYGNTDGIFLYYSNGNTVTGNDASDNIRNNIILMDSSNNSITDNDVTDSVYGGISLFASSNNIITGNDASNSYVNSSINLIDSSNNNTLTNNIANSSVAHGINLESSSNNTIASNTASNNTEYGICLDSSSNNTIYNNYFNNTNNAYDDGEDGPNTWNTTKTPGTNIIGGPYLGGNYWNDYNGTDTDGDGLGNTEIPYNCTGNITNGGDYLPLVPGAGATLEGHVNFTGRGSNNTKWAEPFNVTLFEPGNLSNVLWTGNATTNNTGVFTVSGLTAGTYDIGIKNWTCLSELKTNETLTAGNTTVVDFGTTREGDANNDDHINILDASSLVGSYGSSEGGPDWNAHCDFNRDGNINILDASTLASNYGQHGDLA